MAGTTFSPLLQLLASRTPRFTSEGPQFYKQAYRQNASFAKPGPYQTNLAPAREQAFRRWLASQHVPFDPTAKSVDYDMRGFYQATAGQPHRQGQHFPDTFKTPYDTTFSRESKYATGNNPFVWRGDELIDRRTGQVVFGKPVPKPRPNPIIRALGGR